MIYQNADEATAVCAVWQRRLRLSDWDVKIQIVRQSEMKSETFQGQVGWTINGKQAIIKILDPIDYDPSLLWPQDHEQTLVHELLHLHSAPFDDFDAGGPKDVALEQMIDLTAIALVNAYREGLSHD